jgi:hypothetical protein
MFYLKHRLQTSARVSATQATDSGIEAKLHGSVLPPASIDG